ncbi:sugar ABC transporter permease [Paenibacillus motobuensis]|uniref:Sugar ABC transporter permease n=1 Tax=Paenibacillus lutimineralis TaxID=2707005 RepID=A0A3S9V7B5_9BACL|nr:MULTISPECIES: sugar ABC transporter permease [Paenibacillus]AZS18422.1 sugar ABC transporter permease [Paenibacillus lutimineralis]MCM3042147.1 sugar ABC transporter permease [Paenibacillus lutimineralis]MCM3649251.1 sugar ABC transporter permease [Paenibacillus motobuensis]
MKRQRLVGYVFIAPNLIGMTVFMLVPALFSFYLMFTDWVFASGQPPRFIGLDNFRMMVRDDLFVVSVKNTLLVLIPVPISIMLGFLIAVMLNNRTYFQKTLRAFFFAPYFTSGIAIAFVWMVLFQPTNGPINAFLRSIGISEPPLWFASPDTAMYAVLIMMTAGGIGYNMIIYLAALQELSSEQLEAAKMDGATFGQLLRLIIFPLVSPTTFFLMITGFIGSIKSFGMIYAITQGGPGNSTTVFSIFAYKKAFNFYEMGYASAVSWTMFLIILCITLIQWVGQKKWVHY